MTGATVRTDRISHQDQIDVEEKLEWALVDLNVVTRSRAGTGIMEQAIQTEGYDIAAELPDGPEISCLEERTPDGPTRYICIGLAGNQLVLGIERVEPVPSGTIVGKFWFENLNGEHFHGDSSSHSGWHICYNTIADGKVHRTPCRPDMLRDRFDINAE